VKIVNVSGTRVMRYTAFGRGVKADTSCETAQGGRGSRNVMTLARADQLDGRLASKRDWDALRHDVKPIYTAVNAAAARAALDQLAER
jgi:hypothetical protein